MSVRVLSWVLEHSPVDHRGDLLTLIVLADHASDDGGGAYPSVETLARKARLSRRGVFDALKRLREIGAIVPEGRGPSGTVAYRIHMTNDVQSLHGAAAAPVQSPAPGGAVTSTQGVQCPAPEPSIEPSIEPSSAARASHNGDLEELKQQLSDAGLSIATDRLASLVAKHPAKDLDRAAAELIEWTKRERVRSPAAALDSILTDQPDQPPPPAAPDADAEAAWTAAREQLRSALGDDTFARWLADVELVGQDGATLVLAAPGRAAWIERFAAQITDALDGRPHRIAASNGRAGMNPGSGPRAAARGAAAA